MKWVEILKQSFEYVKKYRALWYLGLLAALTEGGAGGSNFYNFDRTKNGGSDNFSNSVQSSMNSAVDWISSNRFEVGIIILAGFLISILILYISYSARAGLILSIFQAEESGSKPQFNSAFHSGQKYFWRLLGLSILIALMVFAVVFVLIGLITVFIILIAGVSLWFLIIAIPLGLLVFLGIIILAVYLGIILQLAYREIVIKNKHILVAIAKARELIHRNFANVLLAWLIEVAVGFAAGIAMAIIILVIGGALFGIGAGIYFAGGLVAAIIFGSIAALLFVVLTLLLSGIINAYISTYWTIVYKKIQS